VKQTVYIAGPYTVGSVEENIANAIDAAENLARANFFPYIPHLNHYWDKKYPHDYEFWMEQDMEFLRRCDLLLRLPGDSPGADREVASAKGAGIPVYTNLERLIEDNYDF